MRALALTLLAACGAAAPRPVTVPVPAPPVTPPPVPAKPARSPWPVPMRVMTWTADGVEQLGVLPMPAPATPWYVEPDRPVDAATFGRIVTALRDEHIPGLSLRGQPVTAEWLDELRELPELSALLLEGTGVDATALAALDLPLHRLYLAHTEADDAAVAALAAKPALAGLEVLDLEDCAVGDKAMKAIATFRELHAINLSGTRLTDVGGAALGGLAKLSIVDLGDTRVGVRTINALRPLALTELFLDRTYAGKELATLAGFAPGLTRFEISQLQIYKPTDADLAWLATAPNLVEVGLSGAQVHDRLVQAIAAAPKLRRIRLAATPITLPTIQRIARLPDLDEVDLAQTPVDDTSAAALLAMPHMRVVRLDRTAIGDFALRVTPSPELIELYVTHTKVSDAALTQLLALTPKLEALGAGELGVGDAVVAQIAKLPALHTLVLSQAKAGQVALGGLGVLKNLERLYLDNTQVGDAALVDFAHLTSLHTLHLANTEISEESLPILHAFTQLDELTVGDTRMHGGIADLSAWPQLRTLSLMGLDITDAALAQLASRGTLVTIDLSNTDVKDPSPLSALPHLRTLGLVATRLTPAGLAAAKAIEARGVEVVQ